MPNMWSRSSTPLGCARPAPPKVINSALSIHSAADATDAMTPTTMSSSDEGRRSIEHSDARLSLISTISSRSSASSPPSTPGELAPTVASTPYANPNADEDDMDSNTCELNDTVQYVLAPEDNFYSDSDGENLLGLCSIGLGLTSSQASSIDARRRQPIVGSANSDISLLTGPFSHHRSPSWVVQTQSDTASKSVCAESNEKAQRMSVEVVSHASTLTTPPRPIKATARNSSRNASSTSRPTSQGSDQVSDTSSSSTEASVIPKSRISSLGSMNSTLSHGRLHAFEACTSTNGAPGSLVAAQPPSEALLHFVSPVSSSTPSSTRSTLIPSRQETPPVIGAARIDESRIAKALRRGARSAERRTFSKPFATSSSGSSLRSDSFDTDYVHPRSKDTFSGSRPPSAAGAGDVERVVTQSTAFDSMLDTNAKAFLGLDDAFWSGIDSNKAMDEGAFEDISAGLAVSYAEDGRDVCVNANGRTLREIESNVTPSTTHIVLTRCTDVGMLAFLDRILPIVAHSLLVLDLSFTGIHQLPNGLRQCERLEELNLSHNSALQSSNANFDVLSHLRNSLRLLIIDNCELTMLPGSLGHLTQLRMLSACENHLTHLPAWLHQLRRLERLLLVNNPFRGPWQNICQPFSAQALHCAPRPPLSGSNVTESESSDDCFREMKGSDEIWCSSHDFELVEELEGPSSPDEQETTNRSVEVANVPGKVRSFRPFVRKMMSAGDLKAVHEASRKNEIAEAESKWGAIKRKMARKQGQQPKASHVKGALPTSMSATSLAMSSQSSLASTLPTPGKQNAISQCKAENDLAERSANRQITNGSLTLDRKRTRRLSFLPFGVLAAELQSDEKASKQLQETISTPHDAEKYEQHRRSVGQLLRYLEDLSDLNPVQRNMGIYTTRPTSHVYPSDLSLSSSSAKHSTEEQHSPGSSSFSSLHSERSNASPSTKIALKERMVDPSAITSSLHVHGNTSYKDDALRRAHIITEILVTEESYIKTLQELVDIYVAPSAQVDPTCQLPAIPLHERRKVFGNVEGILHFHSEAFLPALRAAARCVSEVQKPRAMGESDNVTTEDRAQAELYQEVTLRAAEQVARTFERHAAFFRMYTSYVNNVDSAQHHITLWQAGQSNVHASLRNGGSGIAFRRDAGVHSNSGADLSNGGSQEALGSLTPKERKRMRAFLHRARLDPRHSQLSLEAYVHLPVQRIPRYRLLFEDLVRVCPPSLLSNANVIANALGSISSIAAMINESKRQSEMDRRLLQWQERIRGTFPSPLVQPHRKLIYDGSLTLRRIVSRVPSFNISRSAVLGDTSITLDSYEEDTMLRVADAMRIPAAANNGKGEDDVRARSNSPNEETMLQVHHLERRNAFYRIHVILCNDITVIVDGPQPGGPFDLFAVLRVTGPARLINEKTIRIADPKRILYLDAASKQEAEAWRRALTSAYHSTPVNNFASRTR